MPNYIVEVESPKYEADVHVVEDTAEDAKEIFHKIHGIVAATVREVPDGPSFKPNTAYCCGHWEQIGKRMLPTLSPCCLSDGKRRKI